VAQLFTDYLEAGDLDGLVSLYEPAAHFVPAPDTPLVGTSAIREASRSDKWDDLQIALVIRHGGC
jgi:hypothetical protein